MSTVMDILKDRGSYFSAVLVERHETYLMGPLLARCPNVNEAYARNYAEREHPSMFLLDFEGIQRAHQQGRMLAKAGIQIEEIIGSEQGRGPDTGLRISEGYQMESGQWVPFRNHKAVNYPLYDYEKILRVLREVGDLFVAQWLNGQHHGLVLSDTPDSFGGRVKGFVLGQLRQSGVRVITTHFEIVTMAHALAEGRDLGTVREDWIPQKGGGLLTIRDYNNAEAHYEFNREYQMVRKIN